MQYYTASIRNHIQASKVVWKLQKDCPCCYIVESRYFLVISVPQFCSLPLTANTSKKANPCSQVVLLPAKFACLFHIVRHVQIVLVGCLNWESVEDQSLVKVSGIQASPDKKKTCLRWASASLYCLEVDVVTLCSATSMWMVWVQTTGSMSINFLRWWKRLLLRLQKLKSGIYLEGWTPISTSPSRSTRATPRLYAMFPSFCSESNVYPCQSKNRATIIISSH